MQLPKITKKRLKIILSTFQIKSKIVKTYKSQLTSSLTDYDTDKRRRASANSNLAQLPLSSLNSVIRFAFIFYLN
jgi:hypothetical protein